MEQNATLHSLPNIQTDSIDRLSIPVVVNGKVMNLKELTTKEMIDIGEHIIAFAVQFDEGFDPVKDFPKISQFCLYFGPILSDWTADDFYNLTPSQIKKLAGKIFEVNKDFLSILEFTGTFSPEAIAQLKTMFQAQAQGAMEDAKKHMTKKESDTSESSLKETKAEGEVAAE